MLFLGFLALPSYFVMGLPASLGFFSASKASDDRSLTHGEGSGSQAMVYVKIHVTTDVSQDFNEVVAICDEDLLGKEFQEGDVVLHVNEEFFKGFLATLDEAIHHARNASIAVFVGEVAVSKAVKEGLVHPDAILRVSGVPYAQVVRL